MSEQEEFEFRARLEQEQAASATTPVTAGGVLREVNKGIGRGATALPMAVGSQLASAVPDAEIAGIPMRIQPNEDVTAFRQRLLSNLKATPGNETERMAGTGAELTSSMLPFMGGPGKIAEKAVGLALPVLGGVQGEQLAGETGKMVGSLAAPVGAAIVGKALSPTVSPEMRQLVDAGFEPTPGQALATKDSTTGQTSGFLKRFEQFPLVREITASARNRAESSYATAVTNIALKPLGKTIEGKGLNGMEKFAKADRLASQAYDDILPKLSIQYDPQFSREMAALQQATPPAIRGDLESLFRTQIIGNLQKDGRTILPRTMKEIDSELGREARRYGRDPAINSQKIADGIRDLQGSLRDMVARQNPQHAEQLGKINSAWNNLVRVGDAVERAGAANGNFTPQQFQQSVKAMDASLRRKAFKTGNAAMQETSNAGVDIMRGESGNVPYSALNQVARYGVAGAGIGAAGYGAAAAGFAAPVAAAAGTLGAMYTPWGQRMMAGALTGNRPQFVRAFGDTLRNAPPLGLATTPMFTQGEQ